MLITDMLICCSLLGCISLTPLMCSENLTRPEPYSKNIFGESRAALDTRLPWYTSGFEWFQRGVKRAFKL